jgi:hypothetical protein
VVMEKLREGLKNTALEHARVMTLFKRAVDLDCSGGHQQYPADPFFTTRALSGSKIVPHSGSQSENRITPKVLLPARNKEWGQGELCLNLRLTVDRFEYQG